MGGEDNDWSGALGGLLAADEAGTLSPEDLPLLAQVAYAAGRFDLTIAAWERAHRLALDAGDAVGAGGAAARVAMHLLFDSALLAPVRGWSARAERLLAAEPPSAAHAWLAVVRAYERLLAGDLVGALPWADLAVTVGEGRDPAATAVGQVAQGRLLVLDGRVAEGLARLDEVGVTSVGGELDPLSTGVVYCELVCAFQGLAQYDLAEQWTEAMERWCATNAIGSLHGRCRVHRAEILRLRGHLAEAEAEVSAACDELGPYVRRELGWPLCELGTIRRQRGDLAGARHAFLAAHHAGWDPQPGLALLDLAEGDVEQAWASLEQALRSPLGIPSKERPPDHDLTRAPFLAARVEIAVAAGEVEAASDAAVELGAVAERFGSRALAAAAALAQCRVALATESTDTAVGHGSGAVRAWEEVGAPYEVAMARTLLAACHRAGGEDRPALLEEAAASAIAERLGVPVPGVAPWLDPARIDPARIDPSRRAETSAARQLGAGRACGDALVWEGDLWMVRFAGVEARLRDRKGIRHLGRLLAEPGREFHVLDLVASDRDQAHAHGSVEDPAELHPVGDFGPSLDEQARTAYRRRLEEIEEDIATALAVGDDVRATRAESEREFLLRELSRAFGLGGRSRREGSDAERARAAVTKAIRQAVAGVDRQLPVLAEHLSRAVRTGTYCAYLPDRRLAGWTVVAPWSHDLRARPSRDD